MRRPCMNHSHRLMLLGSCFATHIGARLAGGGFRCDVNPYGVLYNPLSIDAALREMMAGKVYTQADLRFHQGLWHSPMHHGDFSSPSPEEALRRINERLRRAAGEVDGLDWQARADTPMPKGTPCRVADVDGAVLIVCPVTADTAAV